MLLSFVVPVYKEEKNIPEFLRRLRPIVSGITEDYEIIFSLDPSPDRTEDVILEQRATDDRIKLLKFSRRFGQPMATLAGLEYSSGDAVVVMDVDLQDPPVWQEQGEATGAVPRPDRPGVVGRRQSIRVEAVRRRLAEWNEGRR